MVISEEGADMAQEMEKPLEKDTRDRKPVQELQDLDLKADRCHYTEEFQKEVLHVGIRKILWR